jgi:hypothetical protein
MIPRMLFNIRLYLFFIFLVFAVTPRIVLSDQNKWSELNRQITDLTKKGDCDDAKRTIASAESKNADIPLLPNWHYQVIECQKGDWGNSGMSIIEYYNRQLEKLFKKKSCREAEEFVKNIDNKFKQLQSQTGYAGWSYRVARCYEITDPKKSLALYKQLVASFPSSSTAIEAEFRQNLLIGDRSWIFPKSSIVIDGVKQAFKDKSVPALERLASRSLFLYGFEERLHPAFFNETMRRFFEKKFKGSTILVGELEARNKDLFMLRIVFTDEEYPFWYFMFEQQDGGWQWTGIMISHVARDQPILAPRIKKGP